MFDTTFARDVQQTLDHFRRSVDQLLGSSYTSGYTSPSGTKESQTKPQQVFAPVLEAGWSEDGMFVRAILPGVSEKDVQVSVRGNQLVLEGERNLPSNWTRGANTQLPYGSFYAAVTLPQGLNFDKVNCKLHDGVLDVSIPIADQLKPRQIPISTESTT